MRVAVALQAVVQDQPTLRLEMTAMMSNTHRCMFSSSFEHVLTPSAHQGRRSPPQRQVSVGDVKQWIESVAYSAKAPKLAQRAQEYATRIVEKDGLCTQSAISMQPMSYFEKVAERDHAVMIFADLRRKVDAVPHLKDDTFDDLSKPCNHVSLFESKLQDAILTQHLKQHPHDVKEELVDLFVEAGYSRIAVKLRRNISGEELKSDVLRELGRNTSSAQCRICHLRVGSLRLGVNDTLASLNLGRDHVLILEEEG